MTTTKWVLIDETQGAKTTDGSSLSEGVLLQIAAACSAQLNDEFAQFYGGQYQVRVGADSTDIQPGEQVYAFVATLANAPGASAYHDTDGTGVPVAYCAVTTCSSLLGPGGISVDASHELLEAAADPSCNIMADNLKGLLVAYEVGDPVETQTYESNVESGVSLSNFVLPSWFDPKAPAPYDFMSYAKIDGAVAPPGPLQLAPGNGGNYIITETSTENETDTFGIQGTQRKARRDTGSRFMRRLMGRQVSMKGRMALTTSPVVSQVVIEAEPKMAAHIPPGITERRVARPQPALNRTPGRPVPVSLQNRTALGTVIPVSNAPSAETPAELRAAAEQAEERLKTRVEVRGGHKTPQKGQIDQQRAVLAGRRKIRDATPVGFGGRRPSK
jgi:hypothetical protein